jgi:hypothetical protein
LISLRITFAGRIIAPATRWAIASGLPVTLITLSHRYTHVGKEALSKAAKSLPEI